MKGNLGQKDCVAKTTFQFLIGAMKAVAEKYNNWLHGGFNSL